MNQQSDLLTKTIKDINTYNENLKVLIQNSTVKNETVQTNVYDYDLILNETIKISDNIQFFSNKFAQADKNRHDNEVATLVMLPIFTISGIICII